MPESDLESSGAVATAEPPKPPFPPPRTSTASPAPHPKRRHGWAIAVGLIVTVVVLGALAVSVWLQLAAQRTPVSSRFVSASAFASAMRKAQVNAPPAPTSPVELTSVEPIASHSFEATFTYSELSAVLDAFSHTVNVSGMNVALSRVTIGPGKTRGAMTLSGNVTAAGTTYTGKVSGTVQFVGGHIIEPAPLDVQAEGATLNGTQAQQATQILLAYLNAYLEAAPGLQISSATVTPEGVHASGTAPNSISW